MAPVTATLLLGGFALQPTIAHAEAPSRKPIYDDVEDAAPAKIEPVASAPSNALIPVTPVEQAPRRPTPTDRLAVEIGKARLFLYRQVVVAEDAVNRTVDKAFNLEQSFTNTIASLAPSKESGEKLMPGAVYVLVAAMAGSIVARNKNVFLRATAPLVFGTGAAWVVLPVTMNNVSNLAWKYEQRFPAVASTHTQVRDSIKQGLHFAKLHKDVGIQYVDDTVSNARETVESWVRKGK